MNARKNASGEYAPADVGLSRDLSLLDVTMIGVGAMIGAGIFVLTGIAAGAAGPALILSFALNGIITIFTAMVYAELGSAIPEAGGGYLWVREGLPGANAFLAGWMSWFAHAVAGSLYGLGFGAYLHLVLSEYDVSMFGLERDLLEKGFAIAIILLFLYINYRGSSETGTIGNVITFVKIAILLFFIASGLWVIFRNPAPHLQHFEDFTPEGFTGVLNAMGLTFIAFEGYEIIVQAGEETKNPRKTIPKAVFYSLAIVVPIYLLVAFVAIGAVEPESGGAVYAWLGEHKELGLVEAARQFMPFGTLLLLVGGLFSTMSALNATTYSSTRVSFAMGRDKNLPDAFAGISSRTRTPHKALAFTGGLILFMALAIPIEDVASAADIMFLLVFLQVNVAVISLRRRYGERLRYGYMMPFFPIIPIIGIITKLFLAVFMFNYSAIAWYYSLAWIGLGMILFYGYVRGRKAEEDTTPLVERLKKRASIPKLENDFRVLVPIAHPKSLNVLLPAAIEAVRKESGLLVLLHVIVVPRQLPLSAGRSYVANSRSLMEQARERVPHDVKAELVTRIAHDPAAAIRNTAEEYEANMVVMGWHGNPRNPRTQIGRNIDMLVQEINCDVMVLQQAKPPPYAKMLIPVGEHAQVESVLRLACLVTKNEGAEIDLFHVFSSDTPPDERDDFMERLQAEIDAFRKEVEAEMRTIKGRAAMDGRLERAIVKVSPDYDSLMLGPSASLWLNRRFFDSRPTRLARQVKCPVLLVRPKASTVGFSFFRLAAYLRGRVASASEDKLEDEGVLRPESEAVLRQNSYVNRTGVLAVGVLTIIAVVLMYLGHGNSWTWFGAAGYLVMLMLFTWISKNGIEKHWTHSD